MCVFVYVCARVCCRTQGSRLRRSRAALWSLSLAWCSWCPLPTRPNSPRRPWRSDIHSFFLLLLFLSLIFLALCLVSFSCWRYSFLLRRGQMLERGRNKKKTWLSLPLFLITCFSSFPFFLVFTSSVPPLLFPQALLVLHQPDTIELWNPDAPIETFWDIRYKRITSACLVHLGSSTL